MGAIYELVRGREVVVVMEDQSVLEAARLMADQHIGAAPVLKDGALVGVFSERDIMNRVVAAGLDPAKTKVSDVMTIDVWTVEPEESLENAMILMKVHSIRHLPIVEKGRLMGVVSLRDILLHEVTEMDGEVRAMRAYIQTNT